MKNDQKELRGVCLLGRAEMSLKDELLEEELRTVLLRAGIYPKLKGYDYLMAALRISIYDPWVVKNVTNQLYPVVADFFKTSAGSVERGIRHALDVSTRRNKLCNVNNVIGTDLFESGDRPTNAEFISLIALQMSSAYNKRRISDY